MVARVPHHVTLPGHNRQQVFFRDEDRQAHLNRLFSYGAECRVRVLACCLMTNHVHLILVSTKETGLAQVLGRLRSDYARAANFQRRACGHLREERFYSCAMEGGHALQVIAYMEQNPVRAGMIAAAERYR